MVGTERVSDGDGDGGELIGEDRSFVEEREVDNGRAAVLAAVPSGNIRGVEQVEVVGLKPTLEVGDPRGGVGRGEGPGRAVGIKITDDHRGDSWIQVEGKEAVEVVPLIRDAVVDIYQSQHLGFENEVEDQTSGGRQGEVGPVPNKGGTGEVCLDVGRDLADVVGGVEGEEAFPHIIVGGTHHLSTMGILIVLDSIDFTIPGFLNEDYVEV